MISIEFIWNNGSHATLINVLFEKRGEFTKFWLYDCLAIALICVLIIVVLMVMFSWIELIQFLYFSHNLGWIAWILALCSNFLKNLHCLLILLVIALLVKDD
jgi:hypothetical protein